MKSKLNWEYSETTDLYGNKWRTYCASRPAEDDGENVYSISGRENGPFYARAFNNAYGGELVAVKSERTPIIKEVQRRHKNGERSVLVPGSPYTEKQLPKLLKDIENQKQLWLYTGFCNCVGKVTTEY